MAGKVSDARYIVEAFLNLFLTMFIFCKVSYIFSCEKIYLRSLAQLKIGLESVFYYKEAWRM